MPKDAGLELYGSFVAPTPADNTPVTDHGSIVSVVERGGRNINIWSDGFESDAGQSQGAADKQSAKVAARSELEGWLSTFFDPTKDADTIKALMGFVDQQLVNDEPSSAIMLNMRKQPFYMDRFKGNEGLRAAGLPELDPSQYLAYEKSAAELMASAGLGSIATRNNFATLIGGVVSPAELQDRIVNVYSRIKNADQALKDEMQRLGELGNLNASDFAAALITGKEGAASLQRKIATAEVSSEFTARGIQSSLGAADLAASGVSREQARAGAEYAKTGTQRLTDLANVYGYGSTGLQGELESEAFKGLASERRKKLTQQESASFSGSSGIGTPSLSSGGAGSL